jgi:hypothetical protein
MVLFARKKVPLDGGKSIWYMGVSGGGNVVGNDCKLPILET